MPLRVCMIMPAPSPLPRGADTAVCRVGTNRERVQVESVEPEVKQDILARLRSIEGHVRGIARMVDEDAYCIDIMRQVHAVQKALERVNARVLENHLHTCVTTVLRGDDSEERERILQEIVTVFEETGKL